MLGSVLAVLYASPTRPRPIAAAIARLRRKPVSRLAALATAITRLDRPRLGSPLPPGPSAGPPAPSAGRPRPPSSGGRAAGPPVSSAGPAVPSAGPAAAGVTPV